MADNYIEQRMDDLKSGRLGASLRQKTGHRQGTAAKKRRIYTVGLTGLRYFAHIGVFDQERKIGNDFCVDISVDIAPYGMIAENLDATISYADLAEVVGAEMAVEHRLLESVAENICEAVKERWPQICAGEVKITKITAPVAGLTGSAYVRLSF